MKSHGYREIEIKLPVSNPAAMRRRLAALGARKHGRVYEQDTLYDTPRRQLTRGGELLRLRLEDGLGLLTYKGPAGHGGHYKVRVEIEAPTEDPEGLRAILEALGWQGWFRYEKYRTRYRISRLPGLAVELDETPIGVYLELEGPRKAIDRAARLLGYGPADYLTASYRALYLEHCRKRGLPPGNMLFNRRKR